LRKKKKKKRGEGRSDISVIRAQQNNLCGLIKIIANWTTGLSE